MNKVELIFEGRGQNIYIYIYGNEIMVCYLVLREIINGRSVLEITDKCKENQKDECKNILSEIFYVLSSCMLGEISQDRKLRQ